MSAASNVIEFRARQDNRGRDAVEHEVVVALATADDLSSAMVQVAELIHRGSRATRVEWWARGEDGGLELSAAIGIASGRHHKLPVGGVGAFVLYGGRVEPEITSILITAAAIIRRRAAEERLAQTTIDLARRNEALEDFSALVAHELKNPLQAALLADDPSRHIGDALDLVDALLEAARDEPGPREFVSAARCLDQAFEDVGAELELTTDLQAMVPLPSGTLRVILRNLLANAVAAGAQHVHVAAVKSSHSWRLSVQDDGVGLAAIDRYAAGSGLGLSLCRRIAGRFGAGLELAANPSGGTCAILDFAETV
jgi:signal transduction histidine kinase